MQTNRPYWVNGGSDVILSDLTNDGGDGFLTFTAPGTYGASIVVRDIDTRNMYAAAATTYTMSFVAAGYLTSWDVSNVYIGAYVANQAATHFYFTNYYNVSMNNVSAEAGNVFVTSATVNVTASFYLQNIYYTNIPTGSLAVYFTLYAGNNGGTIRVNNIEVR
jgi:hypothetical protein